MPIKFEWSELFSVDNPELDKQHKGMFDLANSFEEGLDERRIKTIIMDLYKYTREHFEAEEQMMEEINYPKQKEHQLAHKKLIAKLDEVSTQPFDDERSVFKFMTFVYDWLTHHILNVDKDYMRFVHDQGKVLKQAQGSQ